MQPALGLHAYNRVSGGRALFREDADRDHFMRLLGKYLRGPLGDGVRLYAVCPMRTHFHLVVRELTDDAVARLMHRLIAAYAIYYRRKYGGHGPLFDGPYRRVPITGMKQLRWTIAYVHDNHPSGIGYRYSTHRFYESGDAPSWIAVDEVIAAFGGRLEYLSYIEKRRTRKDLDREFFAVDLRN